MRCIPCLEHHRSADYDRVTNGYTQTYMRMCMQTAGDARASPVPGPRALIMLLNFTNRTRSTLSGRGFPPPIPPSRVCVRAGAGQEKEREKGQAARPTAVAEAGPGTADLERGGHPYVLHEAGAAAGHISGACASVSVSARE